MFQRIAKTLRLFVFAMVALLVVLFAVANRHTVTLSLDPLPLEISAPLFLLVVLSFVLGYAWSSIGGLTQRLKTLQENRRQQRKLEALNTEVSALRAEHIHKSDSAEASPHPLLPQ